MNKEIHYILRVTKTPCVIIECDSLAETMESYEEGDIVAKKIPVVFVPED